MCGIWAHLRCKRKIYYLTTFLLTFFSYAWLHAARKAFSNAKTTISEEWTPVNSTVPVEPASLWGNQGLFQNSDDAEKYLGTLDFLFLISYAVGLFISGPLGERLGHGLVLIAGMIFTGIFVNLFAFLKTMGGQGTVQYGALWMANGFAQSFGWPNTVAIMNNWFGKNRRGLIFGLWSSCASVGNIFGALLVGTFLSYGYQFAFLVVSTILIAGGIVCIAGLVSDPRDMGLCDDEEVPLLGTVVQSEHSIPARPGSSEEESEEERHYKEEQTGTVPQRFQAVLKTYWKSFSQPMVILYSISYFCLKLVNYSFFFWLPYYLSHQFNWQESQADYISIWYDIGGIAGGIILGAISDRTQHRAVVLFPCLLLGAGTLFAYYFMPAVSILWVNVTIMTILGFFIGGVACIISAAVCADLGKSIDGLTSDTGTITGIIDGFGSVGAALGQLAVPQLQIAMGWAAVFYFFIIMTMLTALSILYMFIKELRHLITRHRHPETLLVNSQT